MREPRRPGAVAATPRVRWEKGGSGQNDRFVESTQEHRTQRLEVLTE